MIDTTFVPAIALMLTTSVTFADIITVDDDGPADFDTIQDAVDFAIDGDEIVVAPGHYFLGETLQGELPDEVVYIRSKSVTLRSSHGPYLTVIDGTPTKRCITCYRNPSQGTEIIGFTFRNGYVDHLGLGSGLFANDSTVSVTNCIFENNRSEYGGAIFSYASNIDIDDCSFSNNLAETMGGAISCLDSNAEVWNCTFESNYSRYGGAVQTNSSSLVVGNCSFSNNIVSGSINHGGALSSTDSDLTVLDCLFNGNFAVPSKSPTYAGAISIINFDAELESTARIERSVFIGNEATSGGAIWTYGPGDITIADVAFIDNHASNSGGGLITGNEGTCVVDSCSFKMNTAELGSAIATSPDSFIQTAVTGTLFCENNGPAISGEWSDLGANVFAAECNPSPDLTCNGVVDGQDLSILLAQWGPCEQLLEPCIADLDSDGLVDGGDLSILLAAWTNQP